MKQLLFIAGILLGLVSNSLINTANATNCPTNIANKWYEKLKTKISWVDINPGVNDYTIRYYPCTSPTIIKSFVQLALEETGEPCTIVNFGKHKKIEGYCALENIIL